MWKLRGNFEGNFRWNLKGILWELSCELEGTYGNFVETLWELRGNLKGPMERCGNMEGLMGTCENFMGPMGACENFVGISWELQVGPMGTCKNLRELVEA